MLNYLNNMFAPPKGLLGDEEEAIRQQMQMQGLLGLASGLFQAGTPSTQRQTLGGSALKGFMTGKQMAQETFQNALQAQALRQQMEDDKRKRAQEVAQRQALEGFVQTLPETERQRFLAFPTQAAEAMFRPAKQSVQTIYTPEGQETKVLFNESTGQFTPIGGTKAESLIQMDLGNVIELRRPSGEVVGSFPKGPSPSAPSFAITETGHVLNTRTGQVVPATDAKGNPIIIDQSSKASEGERLSSGFYMRMADASNIFSQTLKGADGNPLLKDGNPVRLEDVASKPEVFAEIIGGIIPDWMGGQAAQNFATSPLRQQYQQAQENWVTANLRKESGAVIGPEEMKKEIRKWFPQVNDSPQVIEQKRKSRQVAEESMRKNAGRALTVSPTAPVDLRSAAQKELDRRRGK